MTGEKATGRERFLRVFAGEMPDRVTATLFIIDEGHFINQVYPEVEAEDIERLQLKVIEVQKQLAADVFVRLSYDVSGPLNIMYGGLDVSQQTGNWEVKTEEVKKDNTAIQKSTIRTPDGVLTQEFSINEIRPGKFMYACTKKPINNPVELDIAIKYEPRMQDFWKQKIKKRVTGIKEAVGDDGIVGVWSPRGPFNNVSGLIEHSELYCLFLTDYEFYENLMNFSAERVLNYTKVIDEAGPDVHCVGGNVAGSFLGKKFYDPLLMSHWGSLLN